MKIIPLTQNKFALVDDSDYSWLNQWKWHTGAGGNGRFYAKRNTYKDRKKAGEKMHRLILGAAKGVDVDHRNGDGLDNRRKNLRLCTNSQNTANQHYFRGGQSQYKGVSRSQSSEGWTAFIKVNYKSKYLGLFLKEEDAAKAYDIAAIKYFGEFAFTNKMKFH